MNKQNTVPSNSLLRCVRRSACSTDHFDRIEEVEGLWVMELNPEFSESWEDHISSVLARLAPIEDDLVEIGKTSTEFTLHFSVFFDTAIKNLVIPLPLAVLASRAGFGIEIVLMK